MNELASLLGRAIGGGVFMYIAVEIIVLLIMIWILYAVIKSAVKNAVIELRKELNYTIRKALLESRADIDSGIKEIPDYIPASEAMSFDEYIENVKR